MIHNKYGNSSAERAQGNEVAPLGINARCSSPPPENPRAERYKLLSEARRIFVEAGKHASLTYPQNYHQTAKCIYSRFGESVGINKSREHSRTFYTGVVQCGRVFTCPVCAAKVQERRRLEISQAFDWAYNKNKNKKVILVTFTFPHQRTDELKALLEKQKDAYRRLRSGKAWQKKKEHLGFLGFIRSLEITYSDQNGFHPHTHEAWIVNKNVDVHAFREWLVNRWFNNCSKAGLITEEYEKIEKFFEHAVQITDFASNSDYMAKMDDSNHWGADRELAKSSVKQAKGKGKHPYEFLNESMNGNKRSAALFLKYADAVRGARQIFWSQNLKSKVGVHDMTDEEIAKQVEDKADVLGQLDKQEWNIIVKGNYQSFILDLAETSGIEGVRFWLSTQAEAKERKLTDEIPSEWHPIRKRIYAQIQERAEQLRTTLHDGTLQKIEEKENYLDKKRKLKQSIQRSTLKYYEDLRSHLTLNI